MKQVGGQALVDLILKRRSVREEFLPREVPHEVVKRILECGVNAPSSKNAQPWRLHAVVDTELLAEIADHVEQANGIEDFRPLDPRTGQRRAEYVSTVIESAEILRTAPLAIFVENRGPFTNNRVDVIEATDSARPEAVVGLTLEYIGIGMCIENMWLAAQAQGLCGVFMGDVLIAEDFIKAMLGMAGDLVGVLSLGYSEKAPYPKAINRGNVIWHGWSR